MLWECLWVLGGEIYRTSCKNSFSENISLWEGVLVLKHQYIHMSREYKQQNIFEKIFHFGRVCWCWNTNTYEQREQATKYRWENISLWEGVFDLKGQYTEQATITKKNISLWEGVLILKSQIYRKSYNNSFSENILLWEAVLVLKGQYIHTRTESKLQNSFEKIFHFWDGVLDLKGQYTEQATITKKNISLWEGVLVLKGHI